MSRSFNGSSDNLTRTDGVVTAAPFTVAGWVNFSSAGGGTILIVYDSGTADKWFRLYLNQIGGSDSRFSFETRNASSGTAQSTLNVFSSTNTWFHVAGVCSATNSRTIYVNGANNATDTTNLTPTSIDRTSVGSNFPGGGGFLTGLIGILGIWSIALSGAEVLSLAGGAVPSTVQGASLQNYWKLCGTTSPEPDSGSANKPLTVNGATKGADPPLLASQCAVGGRRSQLALLGVG